MPLAAVAIIVLGAAGAGASGLLRSTSFDDDLLVAPSDALAAVDRLGADVPLPPGGFSALKEAMSRGERVEQSASGSCRRHARLQRRLPVGGVLARRLHRGRCGGRAVSAAALEDVGSWVPLSSDDGGGGARRVGLNGRVGGRRRLDDSPPRPELPLRFRCRLGRRGSCSPSGDMPADDQRPTPQATRKRPAPSRPSWPDERWETGCRGLLARRAGLPVDGVDR